MPVEYFHAIKLAPAYNNIHVQMVILGWGVLMGCAWLPGRGSLGWLSTLCCTIQAFFYGWARIVCGKCWNSLAWLPMFICSLILPIILAQSSCWPTSAINLGESCSYTPICDAQSSLFKKKVDFSHQTQTSQGAVLIDQSNQVDLTLLHTRVGWLN